MKAVLQRCKSASVTVDGRVVSSIGRGVLCLIGVGTGDTEHEREWLASKILGMKLFPEDKDGEVWGWKKSVVDADYEVLCVSQFTLMANLRKGSKPDFHGAMSSETSKAFYEAFLQDMRSKYKADKIFDGEFGAMMDVQLVNDGPVTLILDSTTDAPARPVLKPALTAEQKQKAKEKVERRKEGVKKGKASQAQAQAQNKTEKTEGLTKGQAELVEQASGKRESVLVEEAEKKVKELEESFKSTLGAGI
ncbi:hypothetical protein JCM8547_004662 [Rhodosporidiobolus lusitaniae]